ncbi:HIT family protein [Candidatus Marinamargulisbacteria bacterium SCGC AG-343-D04]|nr:HIT family protein [Candidatus Marinamargulisbacteria bacterium SCGC AG-343-D04]
MSTLFTKIINQEIPSYKLYEDELFYSFLDIRPISEGHSLVIPKIEVDHFFDLPDEYLSKMMIFSRPLVKAIERAIPCLRVGLLVAGLEVPHAHLHCVPIQDMKRFSFAFAKEASSEQLERVHQQILNELPAT